MAFPYFAAIGAGIQALGSLGGLFGKSKGPSLGEQYLYQKALYDYQFNKQLEAMNSAHQREVADLRQAGLNPILSANGGSGLNSPSGSMPDVPAVNSAIVASKQANRQMIMNGLVALGDLAVRAEGNKISDKSAEAAADQARASLINAEQNAINTGSMVQERLFKMSNLDADTKKKIAENNLIQSQMYLNSAYANKANTDAYIASQMMPFDKSLKEAEALYKKGILPADVRSRMVQGGWQGAAIEVLRRAEDAVSPARDWMLNNAKNNFNSAKDAWNSPTTGMFNLFKTYNTVRKFMNNK